VDNYLAILSQEQVLTTFMSGLVDRLMRLADLFL